jgi:Bifunctional DNA primase/polymerase, N-terminal
MSGTAGVLLSRREQVWRALCELGAAGWAAPPLHRVKGGSCTCGHSDCDAPGAHPWPNDARRKALTDDLGLNQVRKLFTVQRCEANVAVRTGRDGKIWALEARGAEGVSALKQWQERHGPLPPTPTARSGDGSVFYFFSYPPARRRLPGG